MSHEAAAACVIVGGGSGSRLGLDTPKALVALSRQSLVEHAVTRAAASGVVTHVIVVAPSVHVGDVSAVVQESPVPAGFAVQVVPGGATRQLSVWNGLQALSDDGPDVVLVHDAARCLAPPTLFGRVARAVAAGHSAVVPVVPVTDTIRSLDDGVVERSRLRAVQTPQGFRRDILLAAHAEAAGRAGEESTAATDDAGLVESLGEHVVLVDGDPLAFKITTPLDLVLAKGVLDSGLAGGDP